MSEEISESTGVPARIVRLGDLLQKEAIVLADASSPQLNIIAVSEKLCSLLGYSSTDLCGNASHVLYWAEDPWAEISHIRSLGHTATSDVVLCVRKDGAQIECVRCVSSCFDQNGILLCLVQRLISTREAFPQEPSAESGPPRATETPDVISSTTSTTAAEKRLRRFRRKRLSSSSSAARERIEQLSSLALTESSAASEERSDQEKIEVHFRLDEPSIPYMLQFRNLSYKVTLPPKKTIPLKSSVVPVERVLLSNMNGYVAPGELLAVMGPTGSGKTTLLNVLSQRVSRGVSGEVLVNGVPPTKYFARHIAYVLQDDILFPFLTVGQTLAYQARLRLSADLSGKEKLRKAASVLNMLNLTKAKDTVIGGPFRRGVSGGERKRVNIGTQLLSDPSIIFLDEPTSGLDTSTAYNVVYTLKEIARNGYAVACTIHQPSAQMFELFDVLMFLIDGNMVYFGPPNRAIEYFGSIGFPCPTNYNAADFMMGLILKEELAGESGMKRTIIDAWKNRGPHRYGLTPEQSQLQEAESLINAQEKASGKKDRRHAISWLNQLAILYERSVRSAISSYIQPLPLLQMLIVAVVAGLIWLRTPLTEARLRDQLGALFFIGLFAGGFTPLYNALYNFPPERAIILREQNEQSYSLSAYYVGKMLAELPFEQVYPLLFVAVSYYIVGLRERFYNFLMFTFIVMASNFASAGLGLMVSAVVYNPTTCSRTWFSSSIASNLASMQRKATVLATIIILCMFLSAGFYIPVSRIKPWLRWLQYISYIKVRHTLISSSISVAFYRLTFYFGHPFAYTYDALIVNQYGGIGVIPGPSHLTGQDVISSNNVLINSVGANIALIVGWGVVFRILAYVFLATSFYFARKNV